MVTYLPISSPFIRFAGRFVDEAFGVAVGYNFFVFEAAMVPFEIVACNFIINYWSDIVPVAGMNAIIIVLYGYVFPDPSSPDRPCQWTGLFERQYSDTDGGLQPS